MSRYIEQERIGKIISNLPTEVFSTENCIELVLSATEAINAIKEAPSIEIIRCRECKYYNNDYMGEWCGRFSRPHGCKPDDFCSYGEREGE